jgi:peptidoglycan/LPS O-acetylase OafA/YrhL
MAERLITAGGGERLHALDAARGLLLLLGIAFHATLSFLPAPAGVQAWIVMDNSRSVALSVLFFTLHMFRMSAFFVLAGFFAHMSFHKKGLRGFVRDRLVRIGVPLVAGWPILFAAIVAATIWGAYVMAHGGPLPPAPPAQPFPAFPLTHLWFLYVLLLLYAVTLLLRGLVVLVDRGGWLRAGADRVVRVVVEMPLGFVLLAAPAAAVLIAQPVWLAFFGIQTPDGSLVPNLPAAAAFATAFGFGWLLHRQTGLLEIWKRRWAVSLVLALGFTAGCLAINGLEPVYVPAAHDARTALFAACYALGVWSWTAAVIGGALRFLSAHSAARRYVADASYWLYLAHMPVVMALQVAVSQAPWPWWAKYPLVLGIALALLLASYQLLVRHSFIGRVLNGRRESRSTPPVHALPEAAE